jgi:hypothetical protein
MKKLSAEAKELINGLLGKGYTPFEIKEAMEDGAYLAEAGISQELSEEVYLFLNSKHTIVNF